MRIVVNLVTREVEKIALPEIIALVDQLCLKALDRPICSVTFSTRRVPKNSLVDFQFHILMEEDLSISYEIRSLDSSEAAELTKMVSSLRSMGRDPVPAVYA